MDEDLPSVTQSLAAKSTAWQVVDDLGAKVDVPCPPAGPVPFKFTTGDFCFVARPNESLDETEERFTRERAEWNRTRPDRLQLEQQEARSAAEAAAEAEAEYQAYLANQAAQRRSGSRPSSRVLNYAAGLDDNSSSDPRYSPDHAQPLVKGEPPNPEPKISNPAAKTLIDEIDAKDDLEVGGEIDEPAADDDRQPIDIAEDCVKGAGQRSVAREYRIYKHLCLDHGLRGAVFLYDLSIQLRARIEANPDKQQFTYDSAKEVSRRTGLTVQGVEKLRRKLVKAGVLVARKHRSRQLQYGLKNQKQFIARLDEADKKRVFRTCLRHTAEKFSIPAAIIYSNRGFWHRKDKPDHHIHDGRHWHYFSLAESVGPGGEYEGYMRKQTAYRALKRLINEKAVLTLDYFDGRGSGPAIYRQHKVWISFDVQPVTDRVVAKNHVRWNGMKLPDGTVIKLRDKSRSTTEKNDSKSVKIQADKSEQPAQSDGTSSALASVDNRQSQLKKAGRSSASPIGSSESPVGSSLSPIGSSESTIGSRAQRSGNEETAEAGPRPLEVLERKTLTAAVAPLPPQAKNLEKKPSPVSGASAGRPAASMPAASPTPTPPHVETSGGFCPSDFSQEGEGNVGFAAEGTEGGKASHQDGAEGDAPAADGKNGTTHQEGGQYGQRAGGQEDSKNNHRPGDSRRPEADVEQQLTRDGAGGVTMPPDVQQILQELATLERRPEAARQPKARPSSSQLRGVAVERKGRPATASIASELINTPVRAAAANAAKPHPPKPIQSKVRASVEPKYKNDQEIAHDQAWSTATYSEVYQEVFGIRPDHAIGDPKTICDNAHKAKLPVRVYIIVALHAWQLAHPGMKFDGRNLKYLGSDNAHRAVLTWLDAAQKVSTRDESGLAIAFGKMKNGEIDWTWVPGPRDKFIEDCRARNGGELSKADYDCLLRLAGDYGDEQRLQRLVIRVRIAIANSPGKTLAEAVRPLLKD